MVALNFSYFSESVKFFTVVHQITPIVSFFSEYLELFSDIGHMSVGLSDVITLAVFDIRPRKTVYLCPIFKSFTY